MEKLTRRGEKSDAQRALTDLVPQDLVNKLSPLCNQIVSIDGDKDCKKDSIDLLLKASGYLEFCVNHVDYVLCNHDMSEAFTFFGLAYMSQLAYVNLLNSKVGLHSSAPNCSLLMAKVIDMLIFQEYIICQEFLGISKFEHANTKCLFSMRNKLFKENLASEIVIMDGESCFITDSNLMYY
ncbi:hypothetical protein GIB67_038373 [Kingdonia uniflora]|uniref:Uncharacterized protein n=1 Tax=Kingdonia uniflora TaxID=39325 RepID=A0A7J7NNY4_9MAGN|nr:hypothetical protein GIB67_038373 [Kingdonia uniflora]